MHSSAALTHRPAVETHLGAACGEKVWPHSAHTVVMMLKQFNTEVESVCTRGGATTVQWKNLFVWPKAADVPVITIKTFTGKQQAGVLHQSSWSTNYHRKKRKFVAALPNAVRSTQRKICRWIVIININSRRTIIASVLSSTNTLHQSTGQTSQCRYACRHCVLL